MHPSDTRLVSDRFPRSNAYDPDWVIGGSMGSHVLWLTEWLSSAMKLKSAMRVLDLGCGRALSSIFLAREFDVQVWATDLWISPSENVQRITDAGFSDQVIPIHSDARGLPFAAGYFDAIVCVDAFSYFGTDALYLNYLANFVKPDGRIGIAGAGLTKEIDEVPEHLASMWSEDFWSLRSSDWWKQHWQRTSIVDVEVADTMTEGWEPWLEWQTTAHPENTVEIDAIRADRGETLGYVRAVGRRRAEAELVDYCWPDTMRSFPIHYEQRTLLRSE